MNLNIKDQESLRKMTTFSPEQTEFLKEKAKENNASLDTIIKSCVQFTIDNMKKIDKIKNKTTRINFDYFKEYDPAEIKANVERQFKEKVVEPIKSKNGYLTIDEKTFKELYNFDELATFLYFTLKSFAGKTNKVVLSDGKLGEYLCCSKSRISLRLKKLEEAGYIKRKTDFNEDVCKAMREITIK